MKIQPQVGNCHGEAPELLCDLGDHVLMEMRGPHPEQDAWLLRVGGTGPPSQSKVAGYSLGQVAHWHPVDSEQVEMWVSPWEA